MSENNIAIEIKNYSKIFKNFKSVDNINFNIKKGSIHGFIGPNGAGKTTTIKAIIGAYLPSKGEITVNGFKAGTKNANKFIGYIPERASFPKHLNAQDYLITMAEFSGLKTKNAKEKAKEILKNLGLEEQGKRKPNKFSSGMQKKILLAQALITNPQILILDEPAANLDPLARFELFDTILKLKAEGKTIFISSHILSELEKIVDQVTFLLKGKIIFSGGIEEFDKMLENAYITTSNNKKAFELLKNNNFNVVLEENEIILNNIKGQDVRKAFILLEDNKLNIYNIKTRDLQEIYTYFVKKSLENNEESQFFETKWMKIKQQIFGKFKNLKKNFVKKDKKNGSF